MDKQSHLSTLIIFMMVLLWACTSTEQGQEEQKVKHLSTITTTDKMASFNRILDSFNVEGCILINEKEDKNGPIEESYFSNNLALSKIRKLPASTFKITNSLIALETGVIPHDSFLIKWDGDKRRMKIWEQDLTFNQAFHYSCVPCYQDIAAQIGVERMNKYLTRFKYGEMIVNDSSLTTFWLEGESGISPQEQIDFLKDLYENKLPVSEEALNDLKRLMIIDQNDQYVLSGKTGWAIRNGKNHGWFVGTLIMEKIRYYFATLIEPLPGCDMDQFYQIRKSVTMEAFKTLGVID